MDRSSLIVALLLLLPANFASAEPNAELAATLSKVVQANLEATQSEDIEAVMKTVHSQSPNYVPTKQSLPNLFENFDLKYRIASLAVVGSDADYAYVRVKQETKKVAGPAFRDNVVDMLQIFRQEDGNWKFWSQAILDIKFVEE